MSCNDVASILGNHRSALLAPAERAKIDAHLAACADCSAAWHAQDELLVLRVPPMPAALLERALLASRLPQNAPPRRARLGIVAGTVLLAGAAAAALVVSMMSEQPTPTLASPPVEQSDRPARATAVEERVVEVEVAPAAPQGDGVTSVELVETALSLAPLVRRPPDYPPDALKQKLEGHVQLKFDVTAAGVVENISVVESSDAQFEDSAIRALSEWRYLPRIVAGKRVAVKDINTTIRWQLTSDDDPPGDQRQVDAKLEAAMRAYAAFSDGLEVAVDRLAADDLRGAELQLDQMLAVYPAAGSFHGDIWRFYGYLFTVQGNYDRAIDAYERAVSLSADSRQPAPWVALANLYFARHQYDLSLSTLVRQKAAGSSPRSNPDGTALIEKLRALGLTHESLETP